MRTRFLRRRLIGSVLLGAAILVLVILHGRLAPILRHFAYLTGWALLAIMLFLTLYNARKKLPFMPLGSSRLWLQLHAYIGYFSAALFLSHISWRLPSGPFEVTLAALFLAVAGSGVLGLWWSRYVPGRLTSAGGEVLYDRIPIIRRQLQERAEALALQSVAAGQTTVIADFYRTNLSNFLSNSRNFFFHLIENRRPMNHLRGRMLDLGRFLTPEQKQHLDALAEIAREKDSLDYQYTLQSSLRWWLFVHIPLTYSLLLATGLHVVLVHAFSLGAGLRQP